MDKREERIEELLNGVEALAASIIMTAVDDYQKALRLLRRNPEHRGAIRRIRELMIFFRSDWFRVLTDADGEEMMEKLKKETEEEDDEQSA